MQHTVQRSLDVRVRRDVVAETGEAVIADQMGDVVRMAGDEVVQPDDRVAIGEEAIGEMRAEEPGGAGDEDSHAVAPRPMDS